jgi:hypothetical protein
MGIAVLVPLFPKATLGNRISLCALMAFPAFVLVFVFDHHFRISEQFIDWLVERAGR